MPYQPEFVSGYRAEALHGGEALPLQHLQGIFRQLHLRGSGLPLADCLIQIGLGIFIALT